MVTLDETQQMIRSVKTITNNARSTTITNTVVITSAYFLGNPESHPAQKCLNYVYH